VQKLPEDQVQSDVDVNRDVEREQRRHSSQEQQSRAAKRPKLR